MNDGPFVDGRNPWCPVCKVHHGYPLHEEEVSEERTTDALGRPLDGATDVL